MLNFRQILKLNKTIHAFYQKNVNKPWMMKFEHWVYCVYFSAADLFMPYTRRWMYECVPFLDSASNIQQVAGVYRMIIGGEKAQPGCGYITFNRTTKALSGDFAYLTDAIHNADRFLKIRFEKNGKAVINAASESGGSSEKVSKNTGNDCQPYNVRKFRADLIRCKYQFSGEFGSSNNYYESYEPLGLEGQRNSDSRIKLYRLEEHLNLSLDVLDIGCNDGFFDLTIAPKVRSR